MSASTPSASNATAGDVVRPPFDKELGDPTKLYPMPEDIPLEMLRQFSANYTPEMIMGAYPHLKHTEYSVKSTTPGEDHTIILSVFKSDSKNANRPGTYHMHGGGQMAGNRFSGLQSFISYFEEAGVDAVHVSVEYRLAPEHPAPAALNDCYTGLVWTAEHAEELGFDPSKLLVVGTSGGGPLAVGSTMLARNKQHPKVYAQFLMTPMLDDRTNTFSAKQYATGTSWTGANNERAWNCILGRQKGDAPAADVSELIAPARAKDLSGLPPTYIDVGECEVMRDEILAFAAQLWKDGITTELHVWPGAWHGFDLMLPDAAVSKAAISAKKAWVKRYFGASEAK